MGALGGCTCSFSVFFVCQSPTCNFCDCFHNVCILLRLFAQCVYAIVKLRNQFDHNIQVLSSASYLVQNTNLDSSADPTVFKNPKSVNAEIS